MSEDQSFRQRRLFGVVVDLPSWLRDETWYCFEASMPDESRLTIEVKDGRVQTLEALVERRFRGLASAYPGVGHVLPPLPVADSPLPALQFSLHLSDWAGTVEIRALALDDQLFVLSYAVGDPTQAALVFDTLRRDEPNGGEPAPGFTRRSLAGLMLDMPSKLLPPTRFVFRGENVDLRLEVCDTALLQPDVEQQLNLQNEEEWWLERPTEGHKAQTEHAGLQWQARDVLASTLGGRRRYRLKEGVASFDRASRCAHVVATASDGGCELLDGIWQEVLHSLRSDDNGR